MAFSSGDPIEYGKELADRTKSPWDFAGQNVMDQFKKKQEMDYESQQTRGMLDYKENLERTRPLSDLEISRANYYDAQTNRAANPNEMSPSRLNQKDKRTTELFQQIERNKARKQQIQRAKKALPTIPTGIGGQALMFGKKTFGSKDPMLKEWQNLKSLLTDSTLLQTANTKGAISDQEMELFREAAANDKVSNEPMMQEALQHLYNYIDAEERALTSSYKHNYGEDPMEWPEMNPIQQAASNQSNNAQDPNDPAGLFS